MANRRETCAKSRRELVRSSASSAAERERACSVVCFVFRADETAGANRERVRPSQISSPPDKAALLPPTELDKQNGGDAAYEAHLLFLVGSSNSRFGNAHFHGGWVRNTWCVVLAASLIPPSEIPRITG